MFAALRVLDRVNRSVQRNLLVGDALNSPNCRATVEESPVAESSVQFSRALTHSRRRVAMERPRK